MGKTSIEKDEVLIACQALGAAGLGDGIGGHVSRRVADQEAFWINAFDRTLSEITENDIFLVLFQIYLKIFLEKDLVVEGKQEDQIIEDLI